MASSILLAGSRAASRKVSFSVISTRGFSASSVRGKDFVQELYLKELKAYKPTALAKDAHVGQVKQIHIPAAPPKPEVPTSASLASALTEYEKDIPIATATTESGEVTPFKSEAESFLEEVAAQDGEKEHEAEKAASHH